MCQLFADFFVMLCGQYFCGRHQTRLVLVVLGDEHDKKRNDGLAAAHIALQQAVHLVSAAQIGTDLLNDTLLRVGQFKGKMVFIKSVKIVAHLTENMPFNPLCVDLLQQQHFHLGEKQLVKLESESGARQVLVAGRVVNLAKRIFQ